MQSTRGDVAAENAAVSPEVTRKGWSRNGESKYKKVRAHPMPSHLEVPMTLPPHTPKCEWTRRMVALTCDFHVFTSRVTTCLSAVLFSIWYIAEPHHGVLLRSRVVALGRIDHEVKARTGSNWHPAV
jgi:hypothetical protein